MMISAIMARAERSPAAKVKKKASCVGVGPKTPFITVSTENVARKIPVIIGPIIPPIFVHEFKSPVAPAVLSGGTVFIIAIRYDVATMPMPAQNTV